VNYQELLNFLAPEALTTVAALGILFNDVTMLRGESHGTRMRWAAWLTVFAGGVGILAVLLSPRSTPVGYAGGMVEITALTQFIKVVLLALAAATALISAEFRFTDHIGEYFALLLLATVGSMFMVSAGNLLLIFVSLELLSLSLYVMTAFNKTNVRSAEAALKYFLFGGISAAFLLFGLSLLYGLTGELEVRRMAAKLATMKMDPLLMVGILGVFVGLGFKVAAVPFHLWAPDAYQGAPLPSAAFIASASKVASFYVLAKLMMSGFIGLEGSGGGKGFEAGWVPVLAVGAALSVVAGNLAAIAQGSVRRLLAYSAVAHAGYMLIGILAAQKAEGMASVMYYVVTYGVTAIGAFAVVGIVQGQGGDDRIASFAGLSRRSPVLAVCLMVFLLSMAGIPPLAGFFGKFYLFKAALFETGPTQSNGLLWLVVLAVAMSAVSLYYYLQVLKQVFVAAPLDGEPKIQPKPGTLWVIVLGGVLVVVLGCLPNLLVSHLADAVHAAGFKSGRAALCSLSGSNTGAPEGGLCRLHCLVDVLACAREARHPLVPSRPSSFGQHRAERSRSAGGASFSRLCFGGCAANLARCRCRPADFPAALRGGTPEEFGEFGVRPDYPPGTFGGCNSGFGSRVGC